MKKHRIIAIMLAALVVLTSVLSGCKGSGDTEEYAYSGSNVSKDPLVIFMDIENFGFEGDGIQETRDRAVNEFLSSLESRLGLTDVVVQYAPTAGAEREAFLDRIRVEIMSGGGPDVFISSFHGSIDNISDNIFYYPQKSMETGIFLDLDEYIQNNTQFAQWDKFPEAVMAAGRNEKGQQIIPITYTLPVITYLRSEVDYTPSGTPTYDDMLNDPELSAIALDLANACATDTTMIDGVSETETYTQNYMQFILGEIADYKEEELIITEDELLALVNKILALDTIDKYAENDPTDYISETYLGINALSANVYTQPLTLIPMYSVNGGATAMIDNYAAVSRNTNKPEEAFSVIDLLLSKDMQQRSALYDNFIYSGGLSMPMHEELFTQENPLFSGMLYAAPGNYEEICEVRNQITSAIFATEDTFVLNTMLSDCRISTEKTIEEIVSETYAEMQRRIRE